MTQDAGTATHGAMRTDDCAACHAHTSGHGRVLADVHVVADLDQVVELHAIFDDRVFEGTAIDAGIGPDLDIVADADGTELFDLDPRTFVRGQPEAVGANHHARVQQTAGADGAALRHRDARLEHRVGTDPGPRSTTHKAPIRAVGSTTASGSMTALG